MSLIWKSLQFFYSNVRYFSFSNRILWNSLGYSLCNFADPFECCCEPPFVWKTFLISFFRPQIVSTIVIRARSCRSKKWLPRTPKVNRAGLKWLGSGFRITYSLQKTARSNAVCGWSRNRFDLISIFFLYLGLLRTSLIASPRLFSVRVLKSTFTATPARMLLWRLRCWSAMKGIPTIGTPCQVVSCVESKPPCVIKSFTLEWDKISFWGSQALILTFEGRFRSLSISDVSNFHKKL